MGHPFIILTDHQSLKELMTQVIQTLEQQQYLAKLLDYDYIIQYRFSFGNVAADDMQCVDLGGQCIIK